MGNIKAPIQGISYYTDIQQARLQEQHSYYNNCPNHMLFLLSASNEKMSDQIGVVIAIPAGSHGQADEFCTAGMLWAHI